MLPISEIRGALIYAGYSKINLILSFFIGLIASSVAIIVLIFLLEKIINFLLDTNIFSIGNLLKKIVKYKTKKYAKNVEVFEELFLIFIAALPIPLAGYYTGCLIAILFKLNKIKSIASLIIGNILSAVFVLLSVAGIIKIFSK